MQERRKCSICLVDCFIECIQLPCGHQYHHECFRALLNANKHKKVKCCECLVEYQFSEDGTKIIQPREIGVIWKKKCLLFCEYVQNLVLYLIVLVGFLVIIWLAFSPFYILALVCVNGKFPPIQHLHTSTDRMNMFFFMGFFTSSVLFLRTILFPCLFNTMYSFCLFVYECGAQKREEIRIEILPDYNPMINIQETNLVVE